MGISKTSDRIKNKIKMPNPNQESPASSKAPNEDLQDMDVLCTFKIKRESQNSNHGYIKDQWSYPYQDMILNLSKEPPASSKAPNQDLKDIDVLWTFKIKIKSKNSDHEYIKDQWPYPNQDHDKRPQSEASNILQGLKLWGREHGCSLNPQNQNREPIFVTLVYQRPVTISKSRSRSLNPVSSIHHPSKPQIGI